MTQGGSTSITAMGNQNLSNAFFGGGCFWCLEAVFQRAVGVVSVVSGYMGGPTPAPTYEAICSGSTGHAEVVRVTFDPTLIRYEDLLDLFFLIHDPTTPDRQGNDVGSQYRSIVFALGAQQAAAVALACKEYAGQHPAAGPVVTQVIEISQADWQGETGVITRQFFPAESHHQNYYREHPAQGYCAVVVAPKLIKAQSLRPLLVS